jgi:hypothetical protein
VGETILRQALKKTDAKKQKNPVSKTYKFFAEQQKYLFGK